MAETFCWDECVVSYEKDKDVWEVINCFNSVDRVWYEVVFYDEGEGGDTNNVWNAGGADGK